ncbi:MAG: hypothetical protein E3J72_03695 [Planctomycetota bacterium]|nr:MAG: hypothetical protein E3J72_03695 [Planctomycetota bacterium]
MPEFEFEKSRKRKYDVWVNSKYRTELFATGIYSPRRFLEAYQVGVIDDVTRSKIVSAEIPMADSSMRIAVKSYHPRGITGAIKDLFRPSKAVREFLFAGKLFAAGLPVPEPLAAMEERRFRRLISCWYFSREVVGAKSVYVLTAGEKTYGEWPDEVRLLFAKRLGRAAGEAHEKGYAHRDLNMSHMIVTPVDPLRWDSVGLDVYFADFEGGRLYPRKIAKSLRLRDVSRFMRSFRLFATHPECIAFFKAYAAGAGENEASAKDFHDAVFRKLGPPEGTGGADGAGDAGGGGS